MTIHPLPVTPPPSADVLDLGERRQLRDVLPLPSRRRVYRVLWEHESDVITYAEIAAKAGVSFITARRAVDDIEAADLVWFFRGTASRRGQAGLRFVVSTRDEQAEWTDPSEVSTRDDQAVCEGEHSGSRRHLPLLVVENAKEGREELSSGDSSLPGSKETPERASAQGCKFEGCTEPVTTGGWCRLHWHPGR